MKLGFIDTAIGAAMKAAEGILGPGSAAMPGVAVPGGAVAPGTALTPRQGPGPVTVSPAIQTQVSPQISPVMTMQQSSPGAQVSASPQQRGGAGQTALPGGPAFPPVPGAYPGPDYGDYARPVGRGVAFPEAFPEPFSPTVRVGESQTAQLMKTGLLAIGVIGGIALLNKNRKKPK